MGIGSLHIEWLSHLAARAEMAPNAAVLELGPQDIAIDRASLRRVAARHLSAKACDKTIATIFNGGANGLPRRDAQPAFYRIFGVESYRSLDLTDDRADFSADLNYPLPRHIGEFDVVTNFGTTEHVFNIGQTFASIHRLLRVGGLQLHAVPGYGFIDHGFYNVHPTAYLDLARENAYEVVDLFYVDNINTRMRRAIEDACFDFGTLPIQRCDMSDTLSLMTKTALLFQQNLSAPETHAAGPLWQMFDLLFVALRRTAKSPEIFVPPVQRVFLGPSGTAAATERVPARAMLNLSVRRASTWLSTIRRNILSRIT